MGPGPQAEAMGTQLDRRAVAIRKGMGYAGAQAGEEAGGWGGGDAAEAVEEAIDWASPGPDCTQAGDAEAWVTVTK